MGGAESVHPTTRQEETPSVAFRLVIALVATAALLLVWRPAFLHAQPSAGATVVARTAPASAGDSTPTRAHVVQAGETLWGLAERYYGDGHAWPTLARLNSISTESDHPPLMIGQLLRVPVRSLSANADAPVAVASQTNVPPVALVPAADSALRDGAAATQSAGGSLGLRDTTPSDVLQPDRLAANRVTRRIGLVGPDDKQAARARTEGQTVFHRDIPDAAEAERTTAALLRPNVISPRTAEFDAAPFAVSRAQLARAGTVGARIGMTSSSRAQLRDEVEVQAASGVRWSVGDRVVAVGALFNLDRGAQGAVPTAVLEVVRLDSGSTAVAVVRSQTGGVKQGQLLVAASGEVPPMVKPERLAQPDIQTTVRWLDQNEKMPTLQSYVLLGAGTAAGVHPGDEFALYAKDGKQERLTVSVRVVRVDQDVSAAVITRQFAPGVTVGMAARRFAKAP